MQKNSQCINEKLYNVAMDLYVYLTEMLKGEIIMLISIFTINYEFILPKIFKTY